MGVAQIEVFPDDGKWRWQERDENGKIADGPSGAYSRAETIEKARRAAGVELPEELFNAEGESRGVSPKRPGRVRVALLRDDGSEYGELDAGPSAGGEPQVYEVQPAGETTKAGG